MNNDVFVADPRWLTGMVGEALADPLLPESVARALGRR